MDPRNPLIEGKEGKSLTRWGGGEICVISPGGMGTPDFQCYQSVISTPFYLQLYIIIQIWGEESEGRNNIFLKLKFISSYIGRTLGHTRKNKNLTFRNANIFCITKCILWNNKFICYKLCKIKKKRPQRFITLRNINI